MMASFLSGSPLIVCLFLWPFRVIAENSSTQLMTQAARVLPFHDRFVLDYQGNGIGLNLTITLLTRHKHHWIAVKNPLTGRVDNRSLLTSHWP